MSPLHDVASTSESFPNGHQFDYVERTTNLTVTATSEATSTTLIDGNAVVFDGNTRVLIEIYAPTITPGTQFTDITLWDGGTDLGVIFDTAVEHTVYAACFITPSAGSHTFHIKAYKGTGTSTIYGGTGGAGNYLAAWYRITKA